jgi:hypothetical protein
MKHNFKNLLLLLVFIIPLFSGHLSAQKLYYPVSEIPEALLKNSDAVIRDYTITKEIVSVNKVITHEIFVVTILNKSGQAFGYFNESYNKLSSVYGYSMMLYNKMGNYIDKGQLNDFKDVKAYDGFSLFDDNRLIYNNWFYDKYPYTIEIRFSRTDKQTLGIDNWYPIIAYNLAVQHASYTLTTTENNDIRFKESNLPATGIRTTEKKGIKYTWELKDFEAIKSESFMPYYENIFPMVKIAANNFSYDGYDGVMTDWKSLGEWEWNLIKDRYTLNEQTSQKIQLLTDSLNTEVDKIKYLYKYLQDNTRYVSIQLGIGGNQPFEATLVDETKYGDCKALSNYMKALLSTVNIESDYAIIRAGKNASPIDESFASHQFNHVILCVPNAGDTIWLECTDQKQPFGYLGSFTDNRTAFLIKEGECVMVKTPEYQQDLNTQFSNVSYKIDSLGNCFLTNHTSYTALQYENIAPYFYTTPKEQKEKLYEKINIPNSTLNSFSFQRSNNDIPSAILQFELSINKFAGISGNRMLIPLNPLNAMTYIPENIKNRKYPILLNSCGYDADTITIELPANYTLESKPEPIHITTPYGEYTAKLEYAENKATYIRSFKWNKGEFPAEEYQNIRGFFKSVANADNAKMVLIR